MGIADFGKTVVFRQKAVTGVNGISAAGGGGGNDVGNISITAAAGGIPNAYGLIC